ncbi:defensin [Vespula squamosa]|uniref:Defensin n=1 Tax=Vespula squamosa TaxID=30214 RepID=A0ABD2APA9_VESSQ
MAKFQFLLALVFVAVMAISAQPVDDLVPENSLPEKPENFGWSCGLGGNNGCAISCAVKGHHKGDDASENLLELVENIKFKEKDTTEERANRQRRVTCDPSSFHGIIGSSTCMANCLNMGKISGYCEGETPSWICGKDNLGSPSPTTNNNGRRPYGTSDRTKPSLAAVSTVKMKRKKIIVSVLTGLSVPIDRRDTIDSFIYDGTSSFNFVHRIANSGSLLFYEIVSSLEVKRDFVIKRSIQENSKVQVKIKLETSSLSTAIGNEANCKVFQQ